MVLMTSVSWFIWNAYGTGGTSSFRVLEFILCDDRHLAMPLMTPIYEWKRRVEPDVTSIMQVTATGLLELLLVVIWYKYAFYSIQYITWVCNFSFLINRILFFNKLWCCLSYIFNELDTCLGTEKQYLIKLPVVYSQKCYLTIHSMGVNPIP